MAIIETENKIPVWMVPPTICVDEDGYVRLSPTHQAQLDRIERMLQVLTGFGYVSMPDTYVVKDKDGVIIREWKAGVDEAMEQQTNA